MNEYTIKCSHSGCVCVTEPGERFCGDHCEALDDTFEALCGCGHPACTLADIETVSSEH